MRAEDRRERRILDVVFGLLLASGLSAGYVFLLAFRNWVRPQGEGAFGIYLFGAFSLIPTGLAWLAGGLQSFRGARDRGVRLGAVLVSCHLAAWAIVVAPVGDEGIGAGLDDRHHRLGAGGLRRRGDLARRSLVPGAAAPVCRSTCHLTRAPGSGAAHMAGPGAGALASELRTRRWAA